MYPINTIKAMNEKEYAEHRDKVRKTHWPRYYKWYNERVALGLPTDLIYLVDALCARVDELEERAPKR